MSMNEGAAPVEVTPERYQQLLKGERDAQAAEAGFDMSNPATELVLTQHWAEGISIADLTLFRDQYNVAVPVTLEGEGDEGTDSISEAPAGKVDEVTGSNGSAAGDIQSTLSGGTSVNSRITTPDPALIASKVYDAGVEKGLSREDAMATALDQHLKTVGSQHVLDRRRARIADDEKAQAIMAGQEAREGAGN